MQRLTFMIFRTSSNQNRYGSRTVLRVADVGASWKSRCGTPYPYSYSRLGIYLRRQYWRLHLNEMIEAAASDYIPLLD